MSRNITQFTEIASRLLETDHLDSGVENREHFHDHLEQMVQRKDGGYALLTKCNVSPEKPVRRQFAGDGRHFKQWAWGK
jgi:hypothetical protein